MPLIVMHVNRFYDWEPLPPGSEEPSEKDIQNLRVKPGTNGQWLMRVPKDADTHTTMQITESDVAQHLIRDLVKFKVLRTRQEALVAHIAEMHVGHHAHRKWMKHFEVNDEGPGESDIEEFTKLVDALVEAGRLEPEDKDDLLEAYTTPATNEDHVAGMHAHFGCEGEPEHWKAGQYHGPDGSASSGKDGGR